MDWDKVRIFYSVAEAGSFTHAGEALDMSQSAVSRQVSSLEKDLNIPLFHRHARGLILTEQGEILFRTAQDVFQKLQAVETRLADSKAKPSGDLRVTTTVGLGSAWLTPRIRDFIDLYPDINLKILLDDNELDLSMREADVAIWLREPTQGDLIRRKLFTVHFHIYASIGYVKRFGSPRDAMELNGHHILTLGGEAPTPLKQINWLETYGLENGASPRQPALTINSIYALKQAVKRGIGLAVLPDYLTEDDTDLVPVMREAEVPSIDTYFVYPEELRNSNRVQVFRDFLVARSQEWSF
jgi:DNA-binding transcriptional LysR family regulator